MRKLFQNKQVVLSIAVLALFSLVLLAGSLQELDFQPGRPFGRPSSINPVRPVDISGMITQVSRIPFWSQAAFWTVLFFLVLLIASLLDPALRKKLIRIFLQIALSAMVFLYLIRKNPQLIAELLDQLPETGNPPAPAQAVDVLPPVFVPPQESGWLSYIFAFGSILLAGIFIWWVYRIGLQFRQLKSPPAELNEIARITRTSLDDLRSGKNFENSIIECYARMSHAVDKKRGLQRDTAMTPIEFAERLARAGLPREPVDRLTFVFDRVRYGGQQAGQPEINEAVASLTAILRYVGEEA